MNGHAKYIGRRSFRSINPSISQSINLSICVDAIKKLSRLAEHQETSTAWHLPLSRRRRTHVCIQRLVVGILQRQRQTEDLCFHSSLHSHWFLFSRSSRLHDLYISSDEKLFKKILTCPNHIQILRTLLPPPTAQNCRLRNRPHNRQLPDRVSRITDCNFTVRMLYRNMYWLLYILALRFVLFLCTTAVWQFAINEYVMLYFFCTRDTCQRSSFIHARGYDWRLSVYARLAQFSRPQATRRQVIDTINRP